MLQQWENMRVNWERVRVRFNNWTMRPKPPTLSSPALSTMMDFSIATGRPLCQILLPSSSQYLTSYTSEFSSLPMAQWKQAILGSPRPFITCSPSFTSWGFHQNVELFVHRCDACTAHNCQPSTRMPLSSSIKWGLPWIVWQLISWVPSPPQNEVTGTHSQPWTISLSGLTPMPSVITVLLSKLNTL